MKYLIATLTLSVLALTSAQASTYQGIVPAKSSVTFTYKQMGVTMDGKFNKFNAQVHLDTARPDRASGHLEIDLASIDTGSGETDTEAIGKSWFNVAAHPKASFVLKQLKPVGANQYEATGQLRIKGQTRDLSVPLKLSSQGQLSGNFILRRADFGIGEGVWARFDVVANDIAVHLNLNLK